MKCPQIFTTNLKFHVVTGSYGWEKKSDLSCEFKLEPIIIYYLWLNEKVLKKYVVLYMRWVQVTPGVTS